MRFAESSAMSEKQESVAHSKIFEARVHELEGSLAQIKEEKDQEITSLKGKLSKLESERFELVSQNKIYEEKHNKFEAEKQKIEQKYQQKLRDLDEEKSEQIESALIENDELLQVIKNKEEQHFTSINQLSNINEVLEDKTQMVETLLKDKKEELESVNQERKELGKEAIKLKKENNKFQEDIRKLEKIISTSKAKAEVAKVANTANAAKMPKEGMDMYVNNMNKEKEMLEKQLKMQIARNEENKKVQEDLMQAFKGLESAKSESQVSNKNLSELLERNNTRCFRLEEKIKKYKKYKKVIESAAIIQCLH